MLNEPWRWDEIERHYRAEEPGGSAGSRLPAPIIGGAWGAVLLVLFGVPAAGAAIAVVDPPDVGAVALPAPPAERNSRRRGHRGIASIPGRHPLEHVPT